jgi:hypothetical protein
VEAYLVEAYLVEASVPDLEELEAAWAAVGVGRCFAESVEK